jgi:transposase
VEEETLQKAFKYKLMPTPEQERALETVLWRCRHLYNAGLQEVLHRLDKAFKAFFRRVKNGEQPGYPRFQGKKRYNSFTYPQVGEHGGATVDGKFLHLAKIGRIHFRQHRPSALMSAPPVGSFWTGMRMRPETFKGLGRPVRR